MMTNGIAAPNFSLSSHRRYQPSSMSQMKMEPLDAEVDALEVLVLRSLLQKMLKSRPEDAPENTVERVWKMWRL